MRRVMFEWRGRAVHSFSVLLYMGLCSAVLTGNVAARLAGIDPFRAFVATCILIFPTLAGARLLFVALNWNYFAQNPKRIWDRSDGGGALYGGILLVVPLSIPLLRVLGLPFATFWDVSGVAIMVGMIFTRIGCLMNGCCAGRETGSWVAMNLPDVHGVWKQRFPTQLLEAGLAAILLAGAVATWAAGQPSGAVFLFVSGGYAFGRLLLESTRETTSRKQLLTIHHVISLFIITLCLAGLAAL